MILKYNLSNTRQFNELTHHHCLPQSLRIVLINISTNLT